MRKSWMDYWYADDLTEEHIVRLQAVIASGRRRNWIFLKAWLDGDRAYCRAGMPGDARPTADAVVALYEDDRAWDDYVNPDDDEPL